MRKPTLLLLSSALLTACAVRVNSAADAARVCRSELERRLPAHVGLNAVDGTPKQLRDGSFSMLGRVTYTNGSARDTATFACSVVDGQVRLNLDAF